MDLELNKNKNKNNNNNNQQQLQSYHLDDFDILNEINDDEHIDINDINKNNNIKRFNWYL